MIGVSCCVAPLRGHEVHAPGNRFVMAACVVGLISELCRVVTALAGWLSVLYRGVLVPQGSIFFGGNLSIVSRKGTNGQPRCWPLFLPLA